MKIIVFVFIFFSFSFFAYMGVLTAINASKNFDDLNYVEGRITATRYIKHKYTTKRKTVFKSVLVLSVEGTSDEFGFTEDSKAFDRLFGFREIDKTAQIYYDAGAKRIEEGVTLHTFDFKIGSYQVVDIAATKRKERAMSIFFFASALIILIITIVSIRKKNKKR